MSAEVDLARLRAESPRLAAYAEAVLPTIGTGRRRCLGVLDRRTIGRYAVAIGDADPVHHDREAAVAAGHADVVAPPNLLSAVVEWGTGTGGADTNDDGTSARIPTDGLRIMGAGERLELLAPVVAGTELWLTDRLESVEVKHGRSGPLLFLTSLHEFADADGHVLNRNHRTILVRP